MPVDDGQDHAEEPAQPQPEAATGINPAIVDVDQRLDERVGSAAADDSDAALSREPSRAQTSRRQGRGRRILGWVMLVTGALLLAGTAWVGWQLFQAYRHLDQASAQVTVLQDQLTNIAAEDPAATARTLEQLQAESAAARSAVEDPIYGVASAVPFLGPNLATIREVAVTVDSLATEVMPSLVEVARTLRPSELAPTDGTIDLQSVERISPLLQSAQQVVDQARKGVGHAERKPPRETLLDARLERVVGRVTDVVAV